MSFDYPEEPLKPFQNPEQDQEQADARDCDIVFADDNELQLDLDTEEQFEIFRQRVGDVLNQFFEYEVRLRFSRSGYPHRHVSVPLFDKKTKARVVLNVWQRIALQFALGSDARRECYSVRKALAGIEKPTCFFEPKVF